MIDYADRQPRTPSWEPGALPIRVLGRGEGAQAGARGCGTELLAREAGSHSPTMRQTPKRISASTRLPGGRWRHPFDSPRGSTIVAEERVRAGRAGWPFVEVRVTDRVMKTRTWHSTGLRVRNRDGTRAPELEQAALERATEIYLTLIKAAARDGTVVAVAAAKRGRLTLREGFQLFFADGRGHFPLDTQHRRETKQYAERVMQTIPGNTPWAELRAAHSDALLESLASEPNVRWVKAQRVVQVLWQARDWLVAQHHLKDGDVLERPGKWRARFEAMVTAAHAGAAPGRSRKGPIRETIKTPVPRRLRYTPGEMKRLYLSVMNARVHAKLRLLVLAFPYARLGQALRLRRSHLHPQWPNVPYQVLRLPGEGKKRGSIVMLTESETFHLRAQMETGYLTEFERAFKRGLIDDYAIFPAHRLRRGVAPLGEDPSHYANDRTLDDWIRTWEDVAGVNHVPQRGHRGLRRVFARRAKRIFNQLGMPDSDVLDLMTGHDEEEEERSTREVIYLDDIPPELLEAGAQIRMHADWMPPISAMCAEDFQDGLPDVLRERWDDFVMTTPAP